MPTRLPEGLFFDHVRADELPDAFRIEEKGFPADEAGTMEYFR